MSAQHKKFNQDLVTRLPDLMRFAVSLCRDTSAARDLVQSTCERALSRSNQFEAGTRFESWLFSIMHSIWKNQLRRGGSEARYLEKAGHHAELIDGNRVVQGKIFLSEVLSKMTQLPDGQAAALTLVCIEGLSYREAAEILEIPQGTLESRVARGRIALGRMLDSEGREESARSKPVAVAEKSE